MFLCEKCGAVVIRRDDHYVSSVGWDDIDPVGDPYWKCEKHPDQLHMRQLAI